MRRALLAALLLALAGGAAALRFAVYPEFRRPTIRFLPSATDLLCATAVDPVPGPGPLDVSLNPAALGCSTTTAPYVFWGVAGTSTTPRYGQRVRYSVVGPYRLNDPNWGVQAFIDLLKANRLHVVFAGGAPPAEDWNHLTHLIEIGWQPGDPIPTGANWVRPTSADLFLQHDQPRVRRRRNYYFDFRCLVYTGTFSCWRARFIFVFPNRLHLHGNERGSIQYQLEFGQGGGTEPLVTPSGGNVPNVIILNSMPSLF